MKILEKLKNFNIVDKVKTLTKKQIGIIIAIVACIIVGIIVLCVCFGNSDKAASGSATTYTVEVKTEGGMALPDVEVHVYENSKLEDLVWVATTDEDGIVSFDAAKSKKYVAVLKNVQEGYEVEEYYSLKDKHTEIILKTVLLKEDDLTKIQYKLGDVIYDFSVTTPDGTLYTISELLKEKDAIVLNFWYLECEPCKLEFPYLQQAYEQFSDDLIVLAMNPVNKDDAAIAEFQKNMGITFPMAQCSSDWEKAMQIVGYPTTVVIDRYGVISFIHSGAITNVESFVEIFEHYTGDEYEQAIIGNMDDLVTYEEEKGSKNNANELGGVNDFTATVAPGQVVYFDVYKVSGMNLQIKDPDAYVIYEGKTYYPENGVVSLKVTSTDTFTPVKIGIGNSGNKEKTFAVTFSFYSGTQGNPHTLKLGEFTAKVSAGNDQGVYYSYKATKDGTLTLQCLSGTKGVDYDFVLYNLDSYAYRTWASDGSTEGGLRTLSIQAKKGQTVQVTISTLPDSANNYPSGTFKFKASFEEGEVKDTVVKDDSITYSITVKDESGKAVPGVYFRIQTSDKLIPISTDTSGVASTKIAKGTYTATMEVPDGYTATATQYTLTEAKPTITVTLKKITVVMANYTVTVVDNNGKAISGVTVSVGGKYGQTNSSGVITFNLAKDDYTAFVSVPSGYTASTTSFPFGNSTGMQITLTKGSDSSEESTTKKTYSVTVTDANGGAKSGVLVQFMKNESTMVTMETTGSNGKVTTELPSGKYLVRLSLNNDTLGYAEGEAVLTSSKTSITIPVATKYVNSVVNVGGYTGYAVTTGNVYVSTMEDAWKLFVFEPTQAGTYKVTTAEGNVTLGDFGANTAFVPSNPNSTATSFTYNVKESQIGGVKIIGIKGVTGCVLKVTRTSDAVYDDTDIPYTTYTGTTESGKKHTPTKYTFAGGTLTNINVIAGTADANKAVLGSDGYYHRGSASGPILYVKFKDASYLSLNDMINGNGLGGGTALRAQYYDGNNNLVKEDYTELMQKYISCMDTTYNVYPLTYDLMYMIQKGGEYMGWWDTKNQKGQYIFDDAIVNKDIAWMFACYY